jgi:uncharacterized protein (TIGR03067 family)
MLTGMKALIVGLIVLMATSLIAAEPSKQDALTKDTDRIQGIWKLAALEADGKPAPAEIVAALKLVFKDDTLTFTPGEPGFTNYKFKLDATTRPAGFAMTHADGANKGETEKGIYSLDGDHLKICFGRLDKTLNEITGRAGSQQSMYSLERVK